MKCSMAIILLFLAATGFSQDNNISKLSRPFTITRKASDTTLKILLQKNAPAMVYVGNNGNGQQVYRLSTDNMPCIRPDSSFQSNMPVSRKGSTMNTMPVAGYRKP